MTMSACSTTQWKNQSVPFQENLKTKCPVKLPRLAGTNGAAAAELINQWTDLYLTCSARHNQLVDEIILREKKSNE
ncbi:hypothetical protein KPNIH27_19575 [Klebsiella pneumoniae subsp. pneumoniae KPNIH27]|nr:hypothetical protein KPNIH27_19575 [Klebsiella pneumoniae subsp. pneumoniae KPNIH27]